MDAQKDNFERWHRSAKGAGAIITTGIFRIRGMPTPVDAAGKPTFTNEALSEQIKASFTEGKREAFWVATVNGIVEAISEFMRPSAAMTALMTSLMNRPATQTTSSTRSQVLPQMGATTIDGADGGLVCARAQPNGLCVLRPCTSTPATGEIAVSRPMPSQVVEQLRQQFTPASGSPTLRWSQRNRSRPPDRCLGAVPVRERAAGRRIQPVSARAPPRTFGAAGSCAAGLASRDSRGSLVNIGGGTYAAAPCRGAGCGPRPDDGNHGRADRASAAHGGDVQPQPVGSQPSRGTTTQGHPPPDAGAGGISGLFFTVDNVVGQRRPSKPAAGLRPDWSSTGQYSDGAIVALNGSQYVANGRPSSESSCRSEVASPVVAGRLWTMARGLRFRAP